MAESSIANTQEYDKRQAKKKARQENKRLPSEEIYDNIGEEIENNS